MKRIIIPAAILALIVAIWSGGWFFIAGQVNAQVAQLSDPDNPNFTGLTCENFKLGGFPFRFDATCTNATLVDGDITVTLPELQVTVLVYRPTHALIFAQGPARYTDAFFGTEQFVRWTDLRASVRTKGWQLARASLQVEGLEYVDTLLGEVVIADAPAFEIHLLDLPEKRANKDEPATLALFAKTTQLNVPAAKVTSADLITEIEISGVPADMRTWSDPAILRAWQAGGGNITIQNIAGETKDANFSLTGKVSLSEQGDAQGELTLASTGIVEKFGDNLTEQMRAIAFGNPRDDGSRHQVMTITGGIIFVGLIPVASLSKLF